MEVDVATTTGSYFSGYDQYKEWNVPADLKRGFPIWGFRCKANTMNTNTDIGMANTSDAGENRSRKLDKDTCFMTNIQMWKESYGGNC